MSCLLLMYTVQGYIFLANFVAVRRDKYFPFLAVFTIFPIYMYIQYIPNRALDVID